MDSSSGYWQIPVAERVKNKTAFTTHLGIYRRTRMPFGLENSRDTFQRAVNIIFSGVQKHACFFYIDDVIFFSKTVTEYITSLDTRLPLLREAENSLKLKNSIFFQPRVDFLCHIAERGRLFVPRETAVTFQAFEPSQVLTQLRSLLGACNVYGRFVQNFFEVASLSWA